MTDILVRFIGVGIGVAIAVFALMGFATPELTTKYFIFLLALGLLANGVVRIITGIKKTEQYTLARTLVIGAGTISIALAILVLAFPGFGRGLLLLIIAIALLINGIQIIILGIRGKNHSRQIVRVSQCIYILMKIINNKYRIMVST